MRYADISVPQPTENIPALPSIPAGVKRVHSRSESQGSWKIKREKQQEDARIAENKLLDKQEFDPDVCEYECAFSATKFEPHLS